MYLLDNDARIACISYTSVRTPVLRDAVNKTKQIIVV